MRLVRLCFAAAGVAIVSSVGWLAVQNHAVSRELERTRRRLDGAEHQLVVERRLEHHPIAVAADPSAPLRAAQSANQHLWNDPSWTARQFNEAYLRVESRYGRFIHSLAGWPPDRVEALKRQLATNDLSLMKVAMLSGSDGKTTGAAVRETESANEDQLRQFMGDSDYAQFQASQRTEQFRQPVDSIAEAMRSQGAPLDDATQESALAAYASAMQETVSQADTADPKTLTPDQFTALQHQQAEAFRQALARKLSGVLDDEHLRLFMAAEMERDGGQPD